jgi:hypothetical protein
MATALIEAGLKRLAHSLSLALWWSGWLVLGELGRRHAPLLADGVAPLVLWMCSVATSMRLIDVLCTSPKRLSNVIVWASMATGGALLWTPAGGGAAALLLASASWGVLTVAADRAARAFDAAARHRAVDIVPAALGALLAWATADRGVSAAVCLIALGGVSLAAACRGGRNWGAAQVGAGHGMPAGWSCVAVAGEDWVVACTRAVMLPMMTSLMFSSDWCVSAGLTDRTTAMGVHLASMFLLPCLLRASGIRLASAWLALPMGASVLMLLVLPGADAWMAASMTQSVAWGLSYVMGPRRAQRESDARGAPGAGLVLLTVGAVAALGLAGATFGPVALSLSHAALGIAAVAAALLSRSPRAAAVAGK